jgi:hypothetical protein
MKLEGVPSIITIDPFTQEESAAEDLGLGVYLADRRAFRYAKVGASDVSKGKLQTAPAPKTNHHNVAVAAAAAIGAKQVTVTLGATSAVANEYSEGYLCINDNTGEGQTYKIAGHPAANSSASLVVTLADPLTVALTTTSEACLVHNGFNGVIEGTSVTIRPAGVPLISLTAAYFGWVQSKGVASVLCETATTLGAKQKSSDSVAGAVEDLADILGASGEVEVGTASIMAGVDTEYRPIVLTID